MSTTRNGGARSSQASTGSATGRTTALLRSRRRDAGGEADPVPAQVARQPRQQPEAALAGSTVAPCRRNLSDAHPERIGLDRELEDELESSVRFDCHAMQEPLRGQPVVAGGVVNREAA